MRTYDSVRMKEPIKITPTELRANIYRLLDQLLDSGVPLEINRRGQTIRISVEPPRGKLERLEPHPEVIKGDPEELVHLDWSSEWKP